MAFDWKSLVNTVAPAIGTALGGPLGGLAVRAVAGAILGNPDATEAETAAALAVATPDQLLALKKADQDFTAQMKALDIDLAKIDAADRDSARKREVDTQDHVTPRVLATAAIIGFFGLCGYVLSGRIELTGENGLMVGTIIGSAFGLAKDVYAYYFGSNSSSRSKDDTIKKLSA